MSDAHDNNNVVIERNDGEELEKTHRPEVSKETRLESDTRSIIKSSELHQLVGTPERTNHVSCVDTTTSLPSETLCESESLPITPPIPPTQQQATTTTTSTTQKTSTIISEPPHTEATTTILPSSSTPPHTRLDTPISHITMGYLNRAVHEFSADFKEQCEAEEVTRDEELTFDQLKDMMLQIFKDQPYLQNEKPNLYFSLMSTYDSAHDSKDIAALRSSMVTNHKALLQTITELNDKVFVLEQTCRPQSHKRHQDDPDSGNPERERRSKRLRHTTFTSSSSQQTSSSET